MDLTITVDRVERVPNWILDVSWLQQRDALLRQLQAAKEAEAAAAQAAAAAAAAAPNGSDGSPSRPATGVPDKSGKSGPGPSSRAKAATTSSASSASGGGGGRQRGGLASNSKRGKQAEDHNPLDDLPKKDHVDTFVLQYAFPYDPTEVQSAAAAAAATQTPAAGGNNDPSPSGSSTPPHPAPAGPLVVQLESPAHLAGWSEEERASWKVAPEWVVPARYPTSSSSTADEMEAALAAASSPLSAKGGKENASSTTRKSTLSGRSTPIPPSSSSTTDLSHSPLSTSASARSVGAAGGVEHVFNPSLLRGALHFAHERTVSLSPSAVESFKRSIEADQPFLMSLTHTRTPTDEKMKPVDAEAARIRQQALALIDLHPLLKPGTTELTGGFVVRQTSAPLPAKPVEEKKKRGESKRNTNTLFGAGGDLTNQQQQLGPDGQPLPPPPPETFDEAHTFIVVHFKLSQPLVARRNKVGLEQLLQKEKKTGQKITTENKEEEEKVQPVQDGTSPAHAAVLEELKQQVRGMVTKMLQEYYSSATYHSPSSPSSSLLPPSHALPPSTLHSNLHPLPSLTPSLHVSSLSTHFLQRLQPTLTSLIETRFFMPRKARDQVLQLSEAHKAHRRNQLYMELSEQVQQVIKEFVGESSGDASTPSSSVASSLLSRSTHLSSLARYAEQHGHLELSHTHHTTRLAELVAWFDQHRDGSELDRSELVDAWFQYGCFLLRRQNSQEDLERLAMTKGGAGDSPLNALRKTGSVDGGVNAAIDLAEVCFHNCLQLNPTHTPSLLCVSLLLLEQDEVEAACEFIEKMTSSSLPEPHVVVSAVRSLYHDLAEEDEEKEEWTQRAEEGIRQKEEQGEEEDEEQDPFLSELLGSHLQGGSSLPLLRSGSVLLLLSRTLSSLGFRVLTKRVLDEATNHMDQLAAEQGDDEGNAPDMSSYAHFGPYLEMAAWYAALPALFCSHTLPLMRHAQSLLESRSLSQHPPRVLLYTFGLLGHIHYDHAAHEEANTCFDMYWAVVEQRGLTRYIEPLVVGRSASLHLLRGDLGHSLTLATSVVTHPLHRMNPFAWSLLSQVWTALGEFDRALESCSEACSIDARNGGAWGVQTILHLQRLQREQHMLHVSRLSGAGEDSSLPARSFLPAHHSFTQLLSCGASDASLWAELGRLWLVHGVVHRAEQAYARALQLEEDEGIRAKLEWIRQEQRAEKEQKENEAATAIQSAIKGALARKQVKQQKLRKKQQEETKEEDEKVHF